jgi:hypothetical protein
MLVLAILLLSCGACSELFFLIQPLGAVGRTGELTDNLVLGSAAGFGLLFGLLLLWQGWTALRGKASVRAARVFPPLFVFAFAYIGAIMLGLGALALGPLAAYALPPWHFIAASLPPLALLAYAARRLGTQSGVRALTLTLTWGALAATLLAFLLEAIVGAMLVLLVVAVLASLPDGRALLSQLQAQVELAQRTGTWTLPPGWSDQPPLVAGRLFYLGLIVPLLEEAVKTLALAFIDPRRTRLSDAVLWGMGAGAGFGIVENLLNAATSAGLWAAVMLLRAGATVVHVANGATMGRGWYAARAERRWGSLFGAYVVSVVYHALWNGTAILLEMTTPTQGPTASLIQPLNPLASGLLAVLVLLTAVGVGWIVFWVRMARLADPAPSQARV